MLKRGFMDGQGLEDEPRERAGGRGPALAPLGSRGGTSPAQPLLQDGSSRSPPTPVHSSVPCEQPSPQSHSSQRQNPTTLAQTAAPLSAPTPKASRGSNSSRPCKPSDALRGHVVPNYSIKRNCTKNKQIPTETASFQQPRWVLVGNQVETAAPHLVLHRRPPDDVLQPLLVVGGPSPPRICSLLGLTKAVLGFLRGAEPWERVPWDPS